MPHRQFANSIWGFEEHLYPSREMFEAENAQAIAAHESPRTTKLYGWRSDQISLSEIERILI